MFIYNFIQWLKDLKFDFKIVGVLFFLWAIINLMNSFLSVLNGILTAQTVTSFTISLIGFVIAWFFYFKGSKIVLRTFREHREIEKKKVK